MRAIRVSTPGAQWLVPDIKAGCESSETSVRQRPRRAAALSEPGPPMTKQTSLVPSADSNLSRRALGPAKRPSPLYQARANEVVNL